jgi:thiamine-monophosphate kinase
MAVAGEHDSSNSGLLRRDAASPGDLIAVTGHLGCAAGGLKLLSDAQSSSGRAAPDPDDAAHLKRAHFRPTPRVSEGIALAGAGVRSAIDLSDGLLDDLGKLCLASNLAATVRADDVPVDSALKSAFPDDWLRLAMGGGEDYELLFTAPRRIMSGISRLMQTPVTVIGEINENSEINEIKKGPTGVTVLDAAGATMAVDAGGWDHFASSQDIRPDP